MQFATNRKSIDTRDSSNSCEVCVTGVCQRCGLPVLGMEQASGREGK